MQEDPAIGFRQAVLRRGLVAAALAGFLLGSGRPILLLPKGRTPDSGRAEAYVDTRTGQLISTSSQSEKQLAAALSRGDCQPAFYCWKCRQWLPVKNPEQQVTTVAGPIRAIHRPVIPGPKTPMTAMRRPLSILPGEKAHETASQYECRSDSSRPRFYGSRRPLLALGSRRNQRSS